jgi:hypothetical protein
LRGIVTGEPGAATTDEVKQLRREAHLAQVFYGQAAKV